MTGGNGSNDSATDGPKHARFTARPLRIGVARSINNRSRVTNRRQLFLKADHPNENTVWGRRIRDLIAEHSSDLGGYENTSAAEQSLIRRCAVLTVELELLEAKFAANGAATAKDLDLYVRASGNLRRLLQTLGIKRRSRDITPSLKQIMHEERSDG